MKKEEMIRDLTWKFFWEQKWEEISEKLFPIWMISIILGVIHWMWYFTPFENEPRSFLFGTLELHIALTWIVIFPAFILLLYKIIEMFIGWIKWNWEMAEKKTKLEMRGR